MIDRGTTEAGCGRVLWKAREGTRLTNGSIEFVTLTGGGYMASLRFVDRDGSQSENVLWEAPWTTREPHLEWTEEDSQVYGREIGRFLRSFTGHALCLDYFGEPSKEKAALGLGLHGEAAMTIWTVEVPKYAEGVACRWTAGLVATQLTLTRNVVLGLRQSVVYVDEILTNEQDIEHLCDWVQHVTFGSPFIKAGESTFTASATRGMVGGSYGDRSLLAKDSEFLWPFAPQGAGEELGDLRQPFRRNGYGFIAGVQLGAVPEHQFLLAINWKSRLGVCYCFRRCDYPWMTIWEENCSRQDSPWNGTTIARGMEFGTSPLPSGEQAHGESRLMFGTTTGCVIPARGSRRSKYLMALFIVPADVRSIEKLAVGEDALQLYDERDHPVLSIPATGCGVFLASSE